MACLSFLAAPSVASPADDQPRADLPRAEGDVLHRVVWDQWKRGRKGFHLRSARLDGTDVRRVYDSPSGFTTDLSLDPAGRWVAFSPCCRKAFPTMVVARVRGREVLEPLSAHPEIYFVGGIGWAPDGRRIAFEGSEDMGRWARTSLFTIRPDGTGLRRVQILGTVRSTVINEALAWTRDGILYSDGRNLMSVKGGETRLILKRVRSVRISGDGKHIVTERYQRGTDFRSVWMGNPDGTEQRQVIDPFESYGDTFWDVTTPNYDGSALLAERTPPGDDAGSSSEVVTWSSDAGQDTATVLDFVGGSYVITWN